MPASTQRSDDVDLNDYPEIIDMNVFEQILEMDDDPDDREFSSEIVVGFFEQAEKTLESMHQEVETEDLPQLSAQGHFLKGSSSTLGLIKLQKSCEKVQNLGKGYDATGNTAQPDKKRSLQEIRAALTDAEAEYKEAKILLNRFFKWPAE